VQDAAARAQSSNNLKQMVLGFHDAASANSNQVPTAYGKYPRAQRSAFDGTELGKGGPEGSFFFHLLPYIEQGSVYKSQSTTASIKTYVAPHDPTNALNKSLTSYAVNETLLSGEDPTMPAIFYAKGSSNCILLVERYAERNGSWAGKQCRIKGGSGSIDYSQSPPGQDGDVAHAFTSGGCQVGLADGTVHLVGPSVSESSFRWACNPKTTSPMPADW
jgi:hypothetical protein